MSLKTKMLGSVSLVMVLVCGLLTVNLMVDGYARQRQVLVDKAEFLRRLTEDWIRKSEGLNTTDWAAFNNKLSTATYVTGWKVVSASGPGGALKVETANTEDRDLTPQEQAIFTKVIAEKRIEIREGRIYAPLWMQGTGEMYAARFELEGREITAFSLTRSVWGIVIIMLLGTLILVLFTYMIMNQMVLRPLDSIVDASRRIAEGDFSKKIPASDRGDEMATMIGAINLMMEKIEAYHLTLKEDIKRAREKIYHTEKILVHAQRLSTTGTLAAGIAHEINNPLGGMINATNMLKSGKLDPAKQGEYLELVRDGLSRIQVIVQKILQFRPKSVQQVPVSIREITDKSIAFLEHKARGKNVTVANGATDDLPQVLGDPLELQQAILNLLMNAVDACEAGRGEVRINPRVEEGRMLISISDNGIGMTPEELQHCMDPFYTTKDQGEGTGLGLAVAASILENHSGKLNIESSKGEGTTVTIELPLPVPHAGAPAGRIQK